MKIACFYDNQGTFIKPILDHWAAIGHEVKSCPYYDPSWVGWADVTFFEWVDSNIQKASREKPAKGRIIARCIDVDAYAKHPGAVDWGWVDDLVFIADHIKDWVLDWANVTPNVKVHHIPCGIDLDKFTFKERSHGLNLAFVGRLWIGKNVGMALQVLLALRNATGDDYKLFIRGDGWHPNWWEYYCKHFIEDNGLQNSVIIEGEVPSIDEWLEDKNYIITPSYKEAFSYVTGEAAAKGIKPLVGNFWGSSDIWPREWIFNTETEAVDMVLWGDYDSSSYRGVIEECYPLKRQLERFDNLISS